MPSSLPLYRSAVCFLAGREAYLKRSANLEPDGQLLACAGISRGGERNGEWEPCCLSRLMDELRGAVRAGEVRPWERSGVWWNAPWEHSALLFSAPTESVKLALLLSLHFPVVQPMLSDT